MGLGFGFVFFQLWRDVMRVWRILVLLCILLAVWLKRALAWIFVALAKKQRKPCLHDVLFCHGLEEIGNEF